MKKSSFIFIIMAGIYLIVAILDGFGWMTITNNVLLGLSLSALLSSISDILYNIGWLKTAINGFNFIIKVTDEFLLEKKINNIPNANSNININGVRQCIKAMGKNYKQAIHPDEYNKKKFITVLEVSSQVIFALSIAVFILLPFLSLPFQQPFSTALTLAAFSAMCFNLYIGEAISDITNKRDNDFMNKEHIIVQTAYPDFYIYLNNRLQPNEKDEPLEETKEVKTDAHP